MPGRREPEESRRGTILSAAYRVAARERLTGLTVRAVAAEAGVSSGLVLFYFASRDALLVSLLGWLLERTIVARALDEDLALPTPRQRLLAVVARDVQSLPAQRSRVELFFDFWVMGTRHPEVQRAIRGALDRYRDALRPLAAEVVAAEPERYAGVSPDGLAAVAAGFVEGCALQVVMDPERFAVEEYLRTLGAVVAEPSLAAGSRGPAG